jgi:hypothetical protein
MSDEHLDKPERRSFMKGVAAAGGAAALAGLSDGAAAIGEEGTEETPPETKISGYRLTSHVLDYYRTLRI